MFLRNKDRFIKISEKRFINVQYLPRQIYAPIYKEGISTGENSGNVHFTLGDDFEHDIQH